MINLIREDSRNASYSDAKGLVPQWGKAVSDYHSHPAEINQAELKLDLPSVNFTEEAGWTMYEGNGLYVEIPETPFGEYFSGYDKQSAYAHDRPIYLGTPSNHVMKNTPPPRSDEFDEIEEGPTEILD